MIMSLVTGRQRFLLEGWLQFSPRAPPEPVGGRARERPHHRGYRMLSGSGKTSGVLCTVPPQAGHVHGGGHAPRLAFLLDDLDVEKKIVSSTFFCPILLSYNSSPHHLSHFVAFVWGTTKCGTGIVAVPAQAGDLHGRGHASGRTFPLDERRLWGGVPQVDHSPRVTIPALHLDAQLPRQVPTAVRRVSGG
jgi:hypothetical protein